MKKALSLFLILALTLTLFAFPSARAMTDVSAELEEQIGVLEMLGVISGFPDGTFRPGDPLTRAQFCKMAVILLGKDGDVGLYKNYTIYPDVKTSHWANGSINLAVKSLKLIKGFPDGTFGPEAPITYAQAITILMRALGYSDADVGLNWPADYLNKAAAVGLTSGIEVSAKSPITRGSGAKLFFNTLSAKTKDGKKFLTTIAGDVKENAVILDNNARAADGTDGAVLIDGEASAVKVRSPLPDSFIGLRGTLIFDAAGLIKAFIPAVSVKKTIVIAESNYPKFVSSEGNSYTLKSDTPVFLDGEKKKFIDVCYLLVPGTTAEVIFTAAGSVDYIIAESPSAASNTVVLTNTPSQSALESMLGAASGGTIYKNGSKSTAADLVKYDVVSYNKAANIFTVTDFKLSGAYEYAYPNTTAPTKITVLGTEFEVLSSAVSQLSKFKISDPITLLFTSDMRVAGAVAQTELQVKATGLYNGTGVELINGTVLKAILEEDAIESGSLVKVYSWAANKTVVAAVSDTNPTISIDINKGTAGDRAIAGNAVFYEKVGADGKLSKISKTDIAAAKIPSGKVFYIGYDSSGQANVIVLNDITGDLYDYGKVFSDDDRETESDPVLGTVYNRFAWVVNSKGESTNYLCGYDIGEQGNWGGIAHDRADKVSKVIQLIKYGSLTRQSFGSDNSMLLGGVRTPISENVHIYINATGKFMTLSAGKTFDQLISDARAFGSSFEAYTDRDPAEGGKIRVIVVK